ncbi:hypothetical protein MSAN_00370200 [Mycena sanguinolenta]|uniref:Uncharacterized protein n=1 Tax=Mycena sanguinolenta TaxID=230812 RepID=A0A8H6ZCF5_9AGAR|nr:hypothetical protein MSAN_00370200 [Mycena sanguinolenta]
MFFISSFTAVISMKDVFDAFIYFNGPGGALAFYTAPATERGWTHWIPGVEDTLQVIIGDALLIYRCYILYNRNYRAIVVPAVTWMAMITMSVTSAIKESTIGAVNNDSILPLPDNDPPLDLPDEHLIVRRLLTVEFRPSVRDGIQPNILTRVAVVFFETGLIYTLSIMVSLGVYVTGSNLEYVATLAIIHIIPITCNLLLIRVESVQRAESPTTRLWNEPYNSKAAEEYVQYHGLRQSSYLLQQGKVCDSCF